MNGLGKCEVCKKNDAIGVASTSMPYSCAYCAECARQGADPVFIFEFYFQDVQGDLSKLRDEFRKGMMTFYEESYLSFDDWVKKAKPVVDPNYFNKEGTPDAPPH